MTIKERNTLRDLLSKIQRDPQEWADAMNMNPEHNYHNWKASDFYAYNLGVVQSELYHMLNDN